MIYVTDFNTGKLNTINDVIYYTPLDAVTAAVKSTYSMINKT